MSLSKQFNLKQDKNYAKNALKCMCVLVRVHIIKEVKCCVLQVEYSWWYSFLSKKLMPCKVQANSRHHFHLQEATVKCKQNHKKLNFSSGTVVGNWYKRTEKASRMAGLLELYTLTLIVPGRVMSTGMQSVILLSELLKCQSANVPTVKSCEYLKRVLMC